MNKNIDRLYYYQIGEFNNIIWRNKKGSCSKQEPFTIV